MIMRKRNTKLTIGGSIGIIALFLMSMIWPATQIIAKAGALTIFAALCFIPLYKQYKQGEDVNRNIGFTIAVLLILGYVLFF